MLGYFGLVMLKTVRSLGTGARESSGGVMLKVGVNVLRLLLHLDVRGWIVWVNPIAVTLCKEGRNSDAAAAMANM